MEKLMPRLIFLCAPDAVRAGVHQGNGGRRPKRGWPSRHDPDTATVQLAKRQNTGVPRFHGKETLLGSGEMVGAELLPGWEIEMRQVQGAEVLRSGVPEKALEGTQNVV